MLTNQQRATLGNMIAKHFGHRCVLYGGNMFNVNHDGSVDAMSLQQLQRFDKYLIDLTERLKESEYDKQATN